MDSFCELGQTPQDSGCYSTFDSSTLIPSTPLAHVASRKRKHAETLDSFTGSPQLSSTKLNESLINHLKDLGLDSSGRSPPILATPEKQLNVSCDWLPKYHGASPLQSILYPSIREVKPGRQRIFQYALEAAALETKHRLLHEVLRIPVIMEKILGHLSGGDLYRLNMVSGAFSRAIWDDPRGKVKLRQYQGYYMRNKENYTITPPPSPEKCDSPPRTNSVPLDKCIKLRRSLTTSQRLEKCRECQQPAMVDHDIAQCDNAACGLIYCLRCSSFSTTGPAHFYNRCNISQLAPIPLSNVSNTTESFLYSSSNSSAQDSGFYSESEPSPNRAKRNLFPSTKDKKVLAINNKTSKNIPSVLKKREAVFVPVVANRGSAPKMYECESPPKRLCAPCSKQSKKSLRRSVN